MRAFSEFCSDEFKNYFYECTQTFDKRTINEYVSSVNQICNRYCKDFLALTESDAMRYFEQLNGRVKGGTLKRKTVGARLSHYRTISQYISEKDKEYHSPFARVIRPEISSDFDPNRIPTMRDLDKIMEEAKSDPQLYLILSLASRVGLESSSILSLKYNSIMREGGKVILHFPPKRDYKKDSYIPMPEDVAILLLRYCGERVGVSGEYLFLNQYKHPMNLVNLDTAVKKVTKKCGLEEYTLKDFRNRAILEMAKSGATMESLENYTRLSPTRLEAFIASKDILSGSCPADLVNYRLNVPGTVFYSLDPRTLKLIHDTSSEMGISESLFIEKAVESYLLSGLG